MAISSSVRYTIIRILLDIKIITKLKKTQPKNKKLAPSLLKMS